jgi:hypothetical protein
VLDRSGSLTRAFKLRPIVNNASPR